MVEFSVASVFSDGCVLQRDKDICVFGCADNGEPVSAKIMDGGRTVDENSCVSIGGKWSVHLRPMPAMENLVLEVSCQNTVKHFSNVAVGEVWLAGGQSNMEFELQNCTEGPAELEMDADPNVRFFPANKKAWMDEKFFEDEKKCAWQTWSCGEKKNWSAVGYFFAKKLARDLGVTVGIIGCNWGGTSASAWTGRERLEKHSDLKIYLDEQEKETRGKSIEEQCAEFDAYEIYNAEWTKKCDALYRENPKIEWSDVQKILGPSPWPGPRSCKSPYRPTGLHECMIKRLAPYTLRGFIFYQGESDDHRPASYYTLFREMIDQWREDWNENLPMIFVQLPGNRYRQDRDFKNWCLIREAQTKIFRTVANTAMTVAADLGEFNDIHPKAKKVLAERMEVSALWSVYGLVDISMANGPIFKSATSRNGTMELKFDFAESGFVLKEDKVALENYRSMEKIQGNDLPSDFTGFEIAGSDGVYHPAKFKFGAEKENLDTITLSSDKVPCPVYARYAWYNYGPATVFGRNGIPLAPFRTSNRDSAPEASQDHADIQQIMEV